ncbi:MAG: hypothetical protein V3U93_01240 [Alphaproteobacteria bacterium]
MTDGAHSRAAGAPGRGNRVQGPACEAAAQALYRDHVGPLIAVGASQVSVAKILNMIGVRTVRGRRWSQVNVSLLLKRVRGGRGS